jgi:hypothetical protein
MKKAHLAIVIGIALCGAAASTHINAIGHTTIYIRNNYGANIASKIVWNKEHKPQDTQNEEPETRIQNGETKKIGVQTMFSGWHPDLLIRTTGKGSRLGLSPYTSLKPYVDKILASKTDYPKAIININPGNYINPWWNIDITYEMH